MQNDIPVFVYGSLKRGGSNHSVLGEDSIFAGTYKTEPKFTLYDLVNFPAVCLGGNTSIVGEVYLVDSYVFEDLDYLEGYPKFYNRDKVNLIPIQTTDIKIDKAWMYFIEDEESLSSYKKIDSGVWQI
jgi:gamma-glutamylaminecyclotransferase